MSCFSSQKMATVLCSFSVIVGGDCSFDRRDRKKAVEIVPLLSCVKNIAHHKLEWGIPDVESEAELILARASMFEIPENVGSMSICPSHWLTLGIGWLRKSSKRSVPYQLSGHCEGKIPKADRGISKHLSREILKYTGTFIQPGAGKHIAILHLHFNVKPNHTKTLGYKGYWKSEARKFSSKANEEAKLAVVMFIDDVRDSRALGLSRLENIIVIFSSIKAICQPIRCSKPILLPYNVTKFDFFVNAKFTEYPRNIAICELN